MPVAALRSLADYELIDSPSNRFIIVPHPTWERLTPRQRKMLREELTEHGATLFHSCADLPDEEFIFMPADDSNIEHMRRRIQDYAAHEPDTVKFLEKLIDRKVVVAGFRNGVSIDWVLERSGPFWMEATSSWYKGNLGAEGRSDLYVWFFWRWVRVYNKLHVFA